MYMLLLNLADVPVGVGDNHAQRKVSTIEDSDQRSTCEGEPVADVPVRTSDDLVQRDQMTLSTSKTTEGSDRRSTRDIPTASMEDKHCETLEQRVNVAENLLSDRKDSKEKEKDQLTRNSEAEMLAIGCEESEKNQENQKTSAPHGTGSADTSSLQDEVFD